MHHTMLSVTIIIYYCCMGILIPSPCPNYFVLHGDYFSGLGDKIHMCFTSVCLYERERERERIYCFATDLHYCLVLGTVLNESTEVLNAQR